MILVSMKVIFEKLSYSDHIAESELNTLLDSKERRALESLGLLKQTYNLKSILCLECGECSPEVSSTGDRLHGVCSQFGDRFSVDGSEVKVWRFDTKAFLELLASRLDIRQDILPRKNGLWQIGRWWYENSGFMVFYSQQDITQQILENACHKMFDSIILTNQTASLRELKGKQHIMIPLEDIFYFRGQSICCRKKLFSEFVLKAHRQTVFHTNGDILVNGIRIVNIRPGSPEYFFVEVLWGDFNSPVSYKEIFSICKENLKKNDYEDTAKGFSHKMKSNIKRRCSEDNKKLVARIFRPSKTAINETGYTMTDPG